MFPLKNFYQCIRAINNRTLINKRYAGHSKWANIRHIKAAKDGQKSQLFEKLCQKMRVAIKEGGSPNPDNNLFLAQIIEVAKKNNMPASTINNYLKTAQNEKSNAQNVWYEIRGPNGSIVIALAFTDHPKKTKDSLSTILRKTSTSFGNNSAKYSFDYKGIVTVDPPKGLADVNESVIEHAIECGAEEVIPCDVEDGVFKFVCELQQLHIVQTKLLSLNYTIKSADFQFIPKMKVELDDNQLQIMSKLLEKLDEHPDIVQTFDNIA